MSTGDNALGWWERRLRDLQRERQARREVLERYLDERAARRLVGTVGVETISERLEHIESQLEELTRLVRLLVVEERDAGERQPRRSSPTSE